MLFDSSLFRKYKYDMHDELCKILFKYNTTDKHKDPSLSKHLAIDDQVTFSLYLVIVPADGLPSVPPDDDNTGSTVIPSECRAGS